jgi:Domain of unknown function (DUF4326)
MADAPVRIQLRRTKGWRMPPNTVKVTRGKGRAGRWGNPWTIGRDRPSGRWFVEGPHLTSAYYCGNEEGARLKAIDFFRRYAAPIDVAGLRGKNLACFCPLDKPCHADVLLELANG